MTNDELRAQAREATLQVLTAGLIYATEGDAAPMTEVMNAVGRSVDPEELVPFLSAMTGTYARVVARLVTTISGFTGQSLQQVWEGVASELAQRPGP